MTTKLEMLRDYFTQLRTHGTATIPIGFDDALDDLFALADAIGQEKKIIESPLRQFNIDAHAKVITRARVIYGNLMQPAEEVKE